MTIRLLEGDSALVTGAAGGIGRAIAAALAEEGAQVFGADLAEADLTRPGGARATCRTTAPPRPGRPW